MENTTRDIMKKEVVGKIDDVKEGTVIGLIGKDRFITYGRVIEIVNKSHTNDGKPWVSGFIRRRDNSLIKDFSLIEGDLFVLGDDENER